MSRNEKKELKGKTCNFFTRREFIIAGSTAAAGLAIPMACRKKATQEKEKAAVLEDKSSKGTSWEGTEPLLKLSDYVHLADVDHFGEFVDFGTAARFKYSMGGWMSGWDNDSIMNGVSITWASGSPSRLYFNLEEAADTVLEFRAKPGGASFFSVYLNDKPITRVTLSDDDWKAYTVNVPAEHTRKGENRLNLIYSSGDKKIGNTPAAFALDYLRIIPSGTSTPSNFDPPHIAKLIQQYKVEDKEHYSIMINCPTTSSFYFEVPKDASFCSFAAPVQDSKGRILPVELKVTVTPANSEDEKEVFKKTFDNNSWQEAVADLKPYQGQLVRLKISATGEENARLALGMPTIRTAPIKAAPSKKIKNAIVVVIDTLRADKTQEYGNTKIKTPFSEEFSKTATLFEHCQANGNWTKPSCASILTGLHPDTHKTRGHASRLGKSIKMVSEVFREKGFNTGAFIANGYLATEFGFNRGWNKYVNYIRERKNTDAENVFNDTYSFIKENGDKPFFTYIQTIDPHVPYDPPEEDLKIYDARPYEGPVRPRSTGQLLEDFKRKRVQLNARDKHRLEALYDGEVTYHDRQFGKFIKQLKDDGKLDETIILVTSDHGEEFFEHDSVGHGHSLFQELLHVPMVIRAPGLYPSGERIRASCELSDIVPTVLEATGAGPVDEYEGRALAAVANGSLQNPFDASFSSFYSEADDRNLQWSVRKGDWKMRMRGPVNTYLHNLEEDPLEKTGVEDKYPLVRRAMRISLGQFIGAPQKAKWLEGSIGTDVIGKPAHKEEQTEELPEDLKQQLRELGYML